MAYDGYYFSYDLVSSFPIFISCVIEVKGYVMWDIWTSFLDLPSHTDHAHFLFSGTSMKVYFTGERLRKKKWVGWLHIATAGEGAVMLDLHTFCVYYLPLKTHCSCINKLVGRYGCFREVFIARESGKKGSSMGKKIERNNCCHISVCYRMIVRDTEHLYCWHDMFITNEFLLT